MTSFASGSFYDPDGDAKVVAELTEMGLRRAE